MARTWDCNNRITTNGGSIDFDYYGKRARQLRADAFCGLFLTFMPRVSRQPPVSADSMGSGICRFFLAARSRAST